MSEGQILDKQNPFTIAEIEQQFRDLFMTINRIGRQAFAALGIKKQIDGVLDYLGGPWRRRSGPQYVPLSIPPIAT